MESYRETQLDALGDVTRRAILARLLLKPTPVGELARDFPVSRPAISQHLRVLKNAGLVADRAEGTRRVYAINPEGFRTVRQYIDQFWTDALAAFKTQAEATAPRPAARRADTVRPPKKRG